MHCKTRVRSLGQGRDSLDLNDAGDRDSCEQSVSVRSPGRKQCTHVETGAPTPTIKNENVRIANTVGVSEQELASLESSLDFLELRPQKLQPLVSQGLVLTLIEGVPFCAQDHCPRHVMSACQPPQPLAAFRRVNGPRLRIERPV